MKHKKISRELPDVNKLIINGQIAELENILNVNNESFYFYDIKRLIEHIHISVAFRLIDKIQDSLKKNDMLEHLFKKIDDKYTICLTRKDDVEYQINEVDWSIKNKNGEVILNVVLKDENTEKTLYKHYLDEDEEERLLLSPDNVKKIFDNEIPEIVETIDKQTFNALKEIERENKYNDLSEKKEKQREDLKKLNSDAAGYISELDYNKSNDKKIEDEINRIKEARNKGLSTKGMYKYFLPYLETFLKDFPDYTEKKSKRNKISSIAKSLISFIENQTDVKYTQKTVQNFLYDNRNSKLLKGVLFE